MLQDLGSDPGPAPRQAARRARCRPLQLWRECCASFWLCHPLLREFYGWWHGRHIRARLVRWSTLCPQILLGSLCKPTVAVLVSSP